MADEKKDKKASKSARKTNRGKSPAARSAAEAKELRKGMLPGSTPEGPAAVDIDVDPTVITDASTAADHPVGEDAVEYDPQIVGGADAAPAAETESK